MRIKISINLPWPIATLAVVLVGGLVTGVALLNYYSYTRINQFEALSKTALLGQENSSIILQTNQEEDNQAHVELSNKKASQAPNEQVFSSGSDFTSDDLSKFLTASVQVICINDKGSASTGSGTLWRFNEVPHAIVTNLHVVKDQKTCVIYIPGKANEPLGFFSLDGAVYTLNNETDTAIIAIGNSLTDGASSKESYNFSLSSLRKCPSATPIGTPVILIGFPMFAKRDAKLTIPNFGTMDETYRSVTNGIISGYDTSKTAPRGPLSHQNFFISAKIDAGNSGGIALAKDLKGICVLGIPTWLSVGTYENQGLIQNIANVIP
ncbi:MAG: serine protease Do [Patescibacteria group bacterium]|nr:serine protease Do [Patescibacteria group bacterium]